MEPGEGYLAQTGRTYVKIELPKNIERFGAVVFGGLQKVFELDSGILNGNTPVRKNAIQTVAYNELLDIYKDMAIIVPVRGERLKLIDGVLCGIPHPCLIIIVSNSSLDPVDRFRMERDAVNDICTFTGKRALTVHQKDPVLAKAFKKVGYKNILDKKGLIRDGKAEGMLIGMMLAKLARKKYIGFVDADNYFPGSVEEYIREYAAGFIISRSPYAMVRIVWHSKPKIVESKLFFRKWGRTSANTNALLNRLVSHYTGFETEIIKTGNAGEHALTTKLAMNIDYSSGYSIEPYHIINMLERYGGIIKSASPSIMRTKIEVFQIESRNPHLHEAGGNEHIDAMSYLAMQVIYHSPICPEPLKRDIRRAMIEKRYIKGKEKPARPHYFPALSSIDEDLFYRSIESARYAESLQRRARRKRA
jgi:mannosyl-3-phosphoglycerate synthase